MIQRLQLILVGLLVSISGAVSAKAPNNLDAIQREARIVADVIKSALRDEVREGMRVTSVESQYLARQGVLVSIDVQLRHCNKIFSSKAFSRLVEPGRPEFGKKISTPSSISSAVRLQ